MATINLNETLSAGFNAQVQKSPLLKSLLSEFGGTLQETQPPATGSFNSGNVISISPALFPGSGVAGEELTWPQLAALIGHELAHAVLPYGNSLSLGSNYVTNAANPSAAAIIGERSESEAYAAEYVIAMQLGNNAISIFQRTPEVQPLFAQLAQDASKNNLNVASIQQLTDLTTGAGSQFYAAATGTSNASTGAVLTGGNTGPLIDNLHISSNENLSYKYFWEDQWILANVYGFYQTYSNSASPPQLGYYLTNLTNSSITISGNPDVGRTFSGTNIPITLNQVALPSGSGVLTTAKGTLTFSGVETNGNEFDPGWYIISAPSGNGLPAENLLYGGSETVLNGRSGTNWFMLPAQWLGSITIVPYKPWLSSTATGVGGIDVNKTLIGGSATQQLQNTGTNQWFGTDGRGGELQLVLSGSSKNYTMTISDPAWEAGDIVIDNFNLSAAESATGFLGIFLQPNTPVVTFGPAEGAQPSSPQSNSQASSGDDASTSTVPEFIAGTQEFLTVSLDAPTEISETVTFTLSDVPASDFEVDTGSGLTSLSSTGTFTVTIVAGESNASFSLDNIADVGGNATLQLSCSMPDEADPSETISGGTVAQNYVEPTTNPFTQPTTATLYDDGPDTYNGTSFELYDQDSSGPEAGTPVSSAASGNNFIKVTGVANDSVQGSTGNDTIYANFGAGIANGGTDVIEGEGGQDILYASNYTDTSGGTGPASVRIYGGSEVSLQTAIQNANNSSAATGQKGDLIVSQVANATVVGSTGNDLILDAGNDLVVAGPGNETIVGGATAANLSPPSGYNPVLSNPDEILPGITWSMSNQNGVLSLTGGLGIVADATTAPTGSEGNYDYLGNALGATNSTIYGGSGNDVIELSNGNNDVELGTGSSTVQGGMGANTIIGGAGNNSLFGGGGSDYITSGDGNSLLAGFGGNNTLMGGAGNDTLYAGSNLSNWATAETGNNSVQAGSGNTQIWGSGGNDTLIGGSGNDTIQAGAGNESIVGGSGTESINGGSGNDTIDVGGDGSDTVYAGTGSTTLYGGDGQDYLHGGSGTTVIYVGDGGTDVAPTYADAGSGNTTIYGGDGVDLLVGGSGTNVIYAGDGGDTTTASTVYVGSGNATVYGGDGIDVINGGGGTDVLYAGDGGIEGCATAVNAGTGVATLYGGAGVSVLTDSVGGSDQLVGGDGTSDMYGIGNDTFVAGTGQDLMSGTGSNTYVFNADGGYDEVVNAGGTETLNFSYDDDPTDDAIVGAETVDDGAIALTISDDDTTVLVDGGLTGADVGSINFGDSQTESLTGLIQAAGAAGNALDSVIAGTNGNLTFDTGSGDSLAGGTGQDTISAWGNNDSLSAGTGGTAIYAEGADARLTGGSGSDTLAAFGANSTLTGGSGNETFEVNDSSEVVSALAGATNTLITSVSYTLPTHVDAATATGNGNVVMQGNTDATNVITGNAGNDTLIGGSQDDTLIAGTGIATLVGGPGADTFVINNTNDVIQLPYGGRGDTVESSVSDVLTQGIGALTLEGSGDLTATDDYGYATITGNAGHDTLIGGAGHDTLVAGSAADTLVAGTGNNTLDINNTADVIQLGNFVGNDTVESSVNYTLQNSLDTLVLTGTNNLVGQGNSDQSNSITGNAGDDTLVAGSGSDTLIAGTGTDTLVAGTGDDVLKGGAGDTYELSAGFGSTLIDLGQGAGTIQFGAGITAADLSVSTVVDAQGNLALQISDGTSVLTLDDGLSGGLGEFNLPGNASLAFQFADGTQLDLAQLMDAAHVSDVSLTGTYGNLVLNSDANASITGGSGDDTLIGTGSGDTIYSGSGNQVLYGLGEGDEVLGGVGYDTLYGGKDTVFESAEFGTQIYAGAGSNTYILNGSGPTTINPSAGETGFQNIVLPAGMTLGDISAQAGSNGDLILTGATGNTNITVIIKGFFNPTDFGAWVVSDQNGNLEPLLNLTSAPSSGSGTESGPHYEAQIAGVLLDDQAGLTATLNQVGSQGGMIDAPDGKESATHYTFQGVSVDNLSVDGGSLAVTAGSESEQYSVYTPQAGQSGDFVSYPVTANTVTYSSGTAPASIGFLQYGSATAQQIEAELEVSGQSLGQPGNVDGMYGWSLYTPPENYPSASYQTTTTTYTEPAVQSVSTETLGFTEYDITGSGDNVSISADAPFVGTVITGDGNNDSVDLGMQSVFRPLYTPTTPPAIGAFIDVGNGLNDTIVGTGGADTITAGLGIDTIEASCGSTVYVPLTDGAVDTIDINNGPYYGFGPYPHNTLVLPEGITPEDLQYRLFTGPVGPANLSQYAGAAETLQISYGGSTVLIDFDSGAPSWQAFGNQSWDTNGINYFQFSDGTVLTRADVLALAGPVLDGADYVPFVTQATQTVSTGVAVDASSLFTTSDTSGRAIADYQIVNNNAQGAYFTLDDQTYGAGADFEVAADQLSQLQYVAGALGSDPQFTVTAFDGINWSLIQTINLTVGGATVQATGVDQTVQATEPDETVVGSAAGSDTLIGGFDGDKLEGGSGYDTFEYTAGGGDETIDPTTDANGNADNILQFGPGITPASLTLSLASDGSLVINTGNPNDNVTLESFDPPYPYSSALNQFEFSDGTSLSFEQLLSEVQPSSGSVYVPAYADTYTYSINAPGGPLYSLQQTNASGQLVGSTTIGADGNSDTKWYQYNSDSTEVISENQSAPDGTDLGDSQTTLDTQGRVSNETLYPPDGSTISETFAYNADGSYQETVVTTPADGSASTTTVYNYDASGNLITGNQAQASGADQTVTGSESGPDTLTGGYAGDTLVGASGQDTFVYDAGSGAETLSETAPVSSSSANVLQFGTGITASELNASINADGSLTLSIGTTGDSVTLEGFNPLNPLSSMPIQQFDFAEGSDLTFVQLLSQVQSSGTEQYVSNPDGTTTVYDFNSGWGALYEDKLNSQGQLMQEYIINTDGSIETDNYTYNSDGTYTDTQVQTPVTGAGATIVMDFDAQGDETRSLTTNPDGSADQVTYDGQGRRVTEIQTATSGETDNSTYSYNSDGSYTVTTIDTPAGGGATTTVVWDVDNQGNLVGSLQTNPDGSTEYDSWNDQGQKLSEVDTAADGASGNTTYSYNADGSYTTTDVETPAGGTPVTTEVISYDTSGNELNDNSYTPGTNGSYSDEWTKPDGSYGSYWWNSSTSQYGESWSDANGTTWTDDYQYASGGSPGSTGVSFTETYSDSAGDQGTRQYDAATGVTTVSWYSAATGTITGVVTDSGFIGLQNDGELTNTQSDLTFFNPTTSPAFQNFLAGH